METLYEQFNPEVEAFHRLVLPSDPRLDERPLSAQPRDVFGQQADRRTALLQREGVL